MNKNTFKDVIKMFIDGAEEGQSAGQGNLKIKGDKLIHYWTPIVERFNGIYVLNNTRYSIVTGRLQKQFREMVPEEKVVIVTGIEEGYKGSLTHFIKEEN